MNTDAENDDARARGQVIDAAATVYEEFFVPALFGQWVDPVLTAVRFRPGHDLVDVGCGTGIVARGARRRSDIGKIVGVDPNQGMLALARAAEDRVEWRAGVAEQLPLPDHAFDCTVSQFAAMFFENPSKAVDEMVRVTRPGGRVAIATWAGVDRSPGYAAMVELLDHAVGRWAAEAMLAPFSIGDVDALRGVIGDQRDDVDVTSHDGAARFASIDAWLHTDVRGWTLADGIDDDAFEDLRAAARSRLAEFAAADGTVTFDAPAIIGTIQVA